jgi:hypothetical protein
LNLALHRVFPWDATAPRGAPFAPDYVPPHQGSGRFDLAEGPVLYLGESADHPVGEVLQGFRGRPFRDAMLRRFGHPLALVRIDVPDDVAAGIVDLDDPARLLALSLRPSDVASDDRARTREIATRLHADGATGLRWWSRLSGDWHSVVLFLARVPMRRLAIGAPELLVRDHPAVVAACRSLGILIP